MKLVVKQYISLIVVLVGLVACGGSNSSSDGSSYGGQNHDNGSRGLFLSETGVILLSANAGSDSVADSDTLIQLSVAIGPDPDVAVGVSSIEWSQLTGPSANILTPNSQTTHINLPSLTKQTELQFQVQVVDDLSRMVTDTVSVIVVPLKGFAHVTAQFLEESDTDQVVNLTVRLTEAQTEPVSIAYETLDGTARAGSDYIADAGVITFAAGQTIALLPITVLSDFDTEGTEEFFVHLYNAQDPSIDYEKYSVLIVDFIPTYSVMVDVSGLVGELVLLNRNRQRISVSSNGRVNVLTDLVFGTSYNLSIESVSSDQNCTLINGSGEAGNSASMPEITCDGVKVPVSGVVVEGLKGTVQLVLNQQEPISVEEAGNFQFPTKLTAGESYSVAAIAPPGQTCTVANGSGTAAIEPITNIEVECVDSPYTVSGSVSGVVRDLAIVLNGSESIPVSSDQDFSFTTELTRDDTYLVTVNSSSSAQTCKISAGSGTVSTSNIVDVSIVCRLNPVLISVQATGLTSAANFNLTADPNIQDSVRLTNDGAVDFSTRVLPGREFSVIQSARDIVTCRLSNDSGVVGDSGETVTASCRPKTATVRASVSMYYPDRSKVTILDAAGKAYYRVGAGEWDVQSLPVGSAYNYTIDDQQTSELCWFNSGSGEYLDEVSGVVGLGGVSFNIVCTVLI